MTNKKTTKPTQKELEILQILWENPDASVRDVFEKMGGEDKNGYTTILKLLQIMLEKGLVTRQKSGKLHLYKAIPTKSTAQNQVVSKMIDTLFQGSASSLVMNVLGNSKASKKELQQIREYLDKLQEGKS
jgi:BlaI family penicillinase repressor